MKTHYRYDWKRATWITWTTPVFNIIEGELIDTHQEWVKELDENQWDAMVRGWSTPTYKIIKNRAWKTRVFDDYQLEVLFKGQVIMVDLDTARTDGLLSAIEKAGKEATGEMKELLRELWLVVRPYKVQAMDRQQAIKDLPEDRIADARPAKEPWTYKDTVKGIMYAVQFRGQTVYIVKAVMLKHGWKKAIEHAAKGSNSEQYKELLRGLWKAV